MEIDKIIVVTRPTRLEDSIRRFNTKSQARFFVESRGQSFDDYELEEDNYQRAKEAVLRSLPRDIQMQVIDRGFLSNFQFAAGDLVLTLGQDGLVVNVAKYLAGQPILAVNPDPDRFDGILLPFHFSEVATALQSYEKDELASRPISMGRVDLNDGQKLYAFNDFFLGANTHVSARYSIQHGERAERHSSSGVIVSTPAGSTGWLSSLYNMAEGVHEFLHPEQAGRGSGKTPSKISSMNSSRAPSKNSAKPPVNSKGEAKPKGESLMQAKKSSGASGGRSRTLSWEEKRLLFMVREPFRSKWSQADLVAGEIRENQELVIESHMPEGGVIFSDGMVEDFLEFNSGTTARFHLAEKTTNLLVE
ncbi:MAG: NAD+ kinase [bacterium]|nr:NAD+ kinase [bacterium]